MPFSDHQISQKDASAHELLDQRRRTLAIFAIMGLLSLFIFTPSILSAAVLAVGTVAELEDALSVAQDNGEDDIINLGQGSYNVTDTLTYDSTEDRTITIQAGESPVTVNGGGRRILSIRTYTENAQVTIQGIIFTGGFVVDDTGAGIFVRTQFGDITLKDVQVKDSHAGSLYGSANAGGAFVRTENDGTILIKDCTFSDNYAKGIGGGLYIIAGSGATVNIINSLLHSNEATTQGGGLYLNMIDGDGTLVNNTLTNNTTGFGWGGGGIYLRLYHDTAAATFYNNIIWGNTAQNGIGGDLYLEDDGNANEVGAAVQIHYNDYENLDQHNGGNIIESDNIDQNPLLNAYFRLGSGSPCMDAGDDGAVPVGVIQDIDGELRILDGDGDGAATVDIGADEYVDSDGDLLPDSLENITCTDPLDADTDDDGIPDGEEDLNGNGERDGGETHPCEMDTDHDDVQDGTEAGLTLDDIDESCTETTVFQPDLDPATTTDPLRDDTDRDRLLDGEEDLNGNGRLDEGETDPNVRDGSGAALTGGFLLLL